MGAGHSETPAWIGSQAGISEEVLPPWTPLVVDRSEGVLVVSCWGRSYEFGKWPFPSAITSGGKSLLRGPIEVRVRPTGKVRTWTFEEPELLEARPDRVRLSQKATSNDLVLSAETTIEYDGMMLIRWELTPKRAVPVELLTFEIPLHSERARYIYYYPHYERSWSEHRPGELTPEGFVDNFRPVMWLGDEERGLEWFAESDENWIADDPSRVTEVKREGDRVVLRLKVVDSSLRLSPDGDQPSLSYTFGLQATPIAPVEKDAWDYRTFHISQPTFGVETRLDISESQLDALKAAGVRTVAFHEHWTDIESYTETTYGDQLRRFVRACHDRGIQVLIYFGFLISDLAPEWPAYGDECVIQPRGGYEPYNYPPQPLQNAYKVCYRSVWQDFLAHGIARLMADYDLDGVYLDGTADPFDGCVNRKHGCGYVAADGSVRNEGDVQVRVPKPYGVPFGALLPQRRHADNLVVPVCVSASHIAFGS
ncbi:MAG: FAD-dependent oxidoreductase, partial [Armatimonadota bacterium]